MLASLVHQITMCGQYIWLPLAGLALQLTLLAVLRQRARWRPLLWSGWCSYLALLILAATLAASSYWELSSRLPDPGAARTLGYYSLLSLAHGYRAASISLLELGLPVAIALLAATAFWGRRVAEDVT